jgi:hypothetical protein
MPPHKIFLAGLRALYLTLGCFLTFLRKAMGKNDEGVFREKAEKPVSLGAELYPAFPYIIC